MDEAVRSDVGEQATLSASAYVELIDTERETEDEKACLCVWVWISDPDSIAIGGVLSLEEPMEYIEEQHIEFSTRPGSIELPAVQNGPAGLLDYEVLLHVDRVVD